MGGIRGVRSEGAHGVKLPPADLKSSVTNFDASERSRRRRERLGLKSPAEREGDGIAARAAGVEQAELLRRNPSLRLRPDFQP